VLLHDAPGIPAEPGLTALAAVHVANVLDRQMRIVHEGYKVPQFDMEYLKAAGLDQRLAELSELCRELIESDDGKTCIS
jgi:hypothetical protein